MHLQIISNTCELISVSSCGVVCETQTLHWMLQRECCRQMTTTLCHWLTMVSVSHWAVPVMTAASANTLLASITHRAPQGFVKVFELDVHASWSIFGHMVGRGYWFLAFSYI